MKSPVDMNMRLSENFTLGEMCRSDKAERHQPKPIPNIPLKRHVTALQNLCQRVLQPARDHFKFPFQITSGYRCPLVNHLVGGVDTSQHCLGEAADFIIPRKHWPWGYESQEQILRTVFNYMRDCVDYDQLILEHRGSSWWIHVSCRIDLRKNRHQAIRSEK